MTEKILSARWIFDCFSWKPIHSELLVLLSAIQAEEKERIGKFVFMKDAKSSLIGRLLIRKYIHDSVGVKWNKIKIFRDDHGKPYYDNSRCPVNFNVSHQGRYVVLAGESGSTKVGVDVMERDYKGGKSIKTFFKLMESNFSSEEWQTIRQSNCEKDQINMFYRYWCLKESYVKAIGVGITIDLKSIVFKIKTPELKSGEYLTDTELWIAGINQTEWEFQEILLDNNYCCSVAVCKGPKCRTLINQFQLITIDEIIRDCEVVTFSDPKFCSEFLKKE